jgi:PPE-repeat protein
MVGFALLPPEVNSARMFAGTGSGSLLLAAAAWDELGAELASASASFESVVFSTLASRSWSGPAAAMMAASAVPYVEHLSRTAAHAEQSAIHARTAAGVFEAARSATVHPAAVAANRELLALLVATNVLGQNTGAIAATEAAYGEMWAQDVTAMMGYQAGVASVASAMKPFSAPLANHPKALRPWGPGPQIPNPVSTGTGGGGGGKGSLLSSVPMMLISTGAEMAMSAGSMLISPLMSLGQMAAPAAAPAAAAGAGLAAAGAPALSGSVGAANSVGAVSAGLAQARTLGSVSVPPSWAGSPGATAASLGAAGAGAPAAAAEAAAGSVASGGSGMPMMAMPGGAGAAAAAGAGDFGGGRTGGWSVLDQARPTVVPRQGV